MAHLRIDISNGAVLVHLAHVVHEVEGVGPLLPLDVDVAVEFDTVPGVAHVKPTVSRV
jgi:hypothetical protein